MPDEKQELLAVAIDYVRALMEQGATEAPIEPTTWLALQALASGNPSPPPHAPVSPRLSEQERSARSPTPAGREAKADGATPLQPAAPPLRSAPLPTGPVQPAGPLSTDKRARMNSLQGRALACLNCPHLVAARQTVVFGVGNIESPVMFVGEAPGADEDRRGEPFVGPAGQLLTRIIRAMGLAREDVYIANVLKCRPDTPGQPKGNRKPTAEEMAACLPYLREQIEIIGPKIIVALGATAMEGLFGAPISITRMRGKIQQLGALPVLPTYHPSYLLHNQATKLKREVWEDMLQVMRYLEMPISEKQQSFFLNSQS